MGYLEDNFFLPTGTISTGADYSASPFKPVVNTEQKVEIAKAKQKADSKLADDKKKQNMKIVGGIIGAVILVSLGFYMIKSIN